MSHAPVYPEVIDFMSALTNQCGRSGLCPKLVDVLQLMLPKLLQGLWDFGVSDQSAALYSHVFWNPFASYWFERISLSLSLETCDPQVRCSGGFPIPHSVASSDVGGCWSRDLGFLAAQLLLLDPTSQSEKRGQTSVWPRLSWTVFKGQEESMCVQGAGGLPYPPPHTCTPLQGTFFVSRGWSARLALILNSHCYSFILLLKIKNHNTRGNILPVLFQLSRWYFQDTSPSVISSALGPDQYI